MWPRGDATNTGPASDMNNRRTRTTGLSGFVAFMKRKDAEEALRELDGFDWGGSILRVGWSKAVPVAARPLYGMFPLQSTPNALTEVITLIKVVKKSHADSHSRSRSRSRSPRRHHRDTDRSRSPRRHRSYSDERDYHHNRSRHSRSRSRSASYSRSRSPSSSRYRRKHSYDHSRRSRSRSPAEDDEQVSETFIRVVAAEVKGHGDDYEKSLQDREVSNPQYAFLKRGVSSVKHRCELLAKVSVLQHRRHKLFQSLVKQAKSIEPEFEDEV